MLEVWFDRFMCFCLAMIVGAVALIALAVAYGVWVSVVTKGLQ